MTIDMFLFLFTIGSTLSSFLTEALKKALTLSSNIIALISALVVGAGGTFSAYILMDVPMSPKNIVCLVLMTVLVWIGSMIGYDKIIQTISQLK